MEARETFRETSVSKVIVVVLGTCLAIALGIAGAVAASDLTAPKAAPIAPVQQVSAPFQTDNSQERDYSALQARNERMQQLEDQRQEKRLGY